jgi:hypothetical protein
MSSSRSESSYCRRACVCFVGFVWLVGWLVCVFFFLVGLFFRGCVGVCWFVIILGKRVVLCWVEVREAYVVGLID